MYPIPGTLTAQPLPPILAAFSVLTDAAGVLTNDGSGNLSWGAGGSGDMTLADVLANGNNGDFTQVVALGNTVIGDGLHSHTLHVYGAVQFDSDTIHSNGSGVLTVASLICSEFNGGDASAAAGGALAYGTGASATDANGFAAAIGYNANAQDGGGGALAIGYGAVAVCERGAENLVLAIGANASALASTSGGAIAIGDGIEASTGQVVLGLAATPYLTLTSTAATVPSLLIGTVQAINSDGSIGVGASQSWNSAVSVGGYAAPLSTAVGSGAFAGAFLSTALGYQSDARGGYSVAIGYGTEVFGEFAVGVGLSACADYDRSTALGYGAETSAADQMMLGGTTLTQVLFANSPDDSSGAMVQVPGGVSVNDGAGNPIQAINADGSIGVNSLLYGSVNGSEVCIGGLTWGAVGSANCTVTIGAGAHTESSGTAVGMGSAAAANSAAIGIYANCYWAESAVAVGGSSSATTQSVAVGYEAAANYDNSIAIGKSAATTAANQAVLGGPDVTQCVLAGSLYTDSGLITSDGDGNLTVASIGPQSALPYAPVPASGESWQGSQPATLQEAISRLCIALNTLWGSP